MAEIDGQFGGRITFEFAGLKIPPCDGDFVLDPSTFNVEAKANQDLTGAYMLKPKLPGCDIKLRHHADVDWDAILRQVGNCTIAEENNGRTHLFTNTRLTGTAKVNLSTGEVDGLRVEGGKYQRLA